VDEVSHKELDEKALLATDKYLDRRALIFVEEGIASYIDRHGVKKTREYLRYMLEYLEEFEN
jgi:hypothetical protein